MEATVSPVRIVAARVRGSTRAETSHVPAVGGGLARRLSGISGISGLRHDQLPSRSTGVRGGAVAFACGFFTAFICIVILTGVGR